MASAMNYLNATVDLGDGTEQLADMHVVVRQNIATLARTGHQGVVKQGVSAVRRAGNRQAVVEFVDGTVWKVEAPDRSKGGCGCNG